MIRKIYFISGLITLLAFWNIEIPKRAFRFYQRGDLVKTVEALDRSIAKDTLNPAAYYLYARLFTDTAFDRYDVDTAYLYTNQAFDQLQFVTEPKDIEDLQELSVDSVSLERLKDKVDSLKFIDIKAIHTIEAYNWFMQSHNDANQIEEAIRLRNHIAFQKSEAINTWQGYQQYMGEYPVSEDFAEAEKRYKRLIYEERTADGSYQSLTSFLEEFPNTPYRKNVVAEIFQYATAENTLDSFRKFLIDYASTDFNSILADRAYHIYKTKYPDGDFFEDFDFALSMDSLRNAQSLEGEFWMPKLENGKVNYVSKSGENRLQTSFETLTEDCLCNPSFNDILYGTTGNKKQVIGRNGHAIYEGIFEEVIDGGHGLLVIRNVEGDRLIHKSGQVIIDSPKEEIKVLTNSLIRTKENGLFGLESIHGLPYLPNEFTAIDTFKTKLWLEKENGIQLIDGTSLLPVLLGAKPPAFIPQYDELEELPNGRIWAIRDDKESILNQNFETIIPFGAYEIYERAYGWKLETQGKIQLVHDRYNDLLRGKNYDRILENDRWLALEQDSTWTLLDQVGNARPSFGYDSLSFWGENMVMKFRGDSTWAQFKTGKELLMRDDWEPQLLIPQQYITTGEKALSDYFMLTNEKKFRKIYNTYGREILASTYNDVTALSPNMIRLQKRNAALADSTGHFLLNFIYDGIGSNKDGYVSILDKGKVGVINPEKNINIPPTFDKLIEPYGDTVLIASDGKYKGFINAKAESLTSFEFDEVVYYNDTLALTRIENEWLMYDIASDEALYEGILTYEYILEDDLDKTLLINTEDGEGIYSLTKGELIEPTYTEIKVLGSSDEPIYFAMKLVPEADIYIVIYFDKTANKIFTQSFPREAYFRIACPSK
ncbi:WG repeat-containing protein [Roseivirga sp. E12]|uniref:WG repeat-containing protein n=1 Tax=Roseivirga sp. E12 TaxID=2819237 RepID=UPI001ABC3874|nr:WG repeat-containing protein [Roseivirga sp. E12]MBO3698977.1 WG repeat-containing protein [Roseivirga sp. E12]